MRIAAPTFILHDGALEVIARNADHERRLALLNPPAVVGELSLLAVRAERPETVYVA